jgi:hypothetical protein
LTRLPGLPDRHTLPAAPDVSGMRGFRLGLRVRTKKGTAASAGQSGLAAVDPMEVHPMKSLARWSAPALLLLLPVAAFAQPLPVVVSGYAPVVTPAPTVTYYTPAPTVTYYTPPVVAYSPPVVAAPAPVVVQSGYYAPTVSYYAPRPAIAAYAPVATVERPRLFRRPVVTTYYAPVVLP